LCRQRASVQKKLTFSRGRGYRTLVPFRVATRFAIVFSHLKRSMRFEVVNIVLGVLIGSMVGLVDLIHDIKAAKDAGATDAELQNAWQAQREGGFSIDFLVSENSMGFHADQYSVTEFAQAINTCREGQLALRRDVKSVSVQFPTIPKTQLGQPSQNEK
ncbi:MAG TPA: ammonia-forming cytochrome c nitrite reductase subunit c552, partial [Chthoniobacterales bacterium]